MSRNHPRRTWQPVSSSAKLSLRKQGRHHDVLGHRECGPTLPRAKGGAWALRLAAGAARPLAARLELLAGSSMKQPEVMKM